MRVDNSRVINYNSNLFMFLLRLYSSYVSLISSLLFTSYNIYTKIQFYTLFHIVTVSQYYLNAIEAIWCLNSIGFPMTL